MKLLENRLYIFGNVPDGTSFFVNKPIFTVVMNLLFSSTRSEPRIIDLVSGSWAQRSDVLCIGDVIVSVNGIDASALTQSGLVQTLDESDR